MEAEIEGRGGVEFSSLSVLSLDGKSSVFMFFDWFDFAIGCRYLSSWFWF